MKTNSTANIVVSGIGVTTAIGQGKSAFFNSLLRAEHAFDVMRRPGRQLSNAESQFFLGAEISELAIPDTIKQTQLRTASPSSQVALATLDEAWQDAALKEVDPYRIGLIVGGSNLQ